MHRTPSKKVIIQEPDNVSMAFRGPAIGDVIPETPRDADISANISKLLPT